MLPGSFISQTMANTVSAGRCRHRIITTVAGTGTGGYTGDGGAATALG